MLKRFIVLLLLPLSMYSQQYKINIGRFSTEDKVFYGTIDDKYDITLYLKISAQSEDHTAIYTVKGWYQYDNIKKHIPLVGLYDFSDGLTLYSLKDKALENKIAAFDVPGEYVWGKIEYIKAIADFDEKLTIGNDDTNNRWASKNKELKLKIANPGNISIANDFTFLNLDKDTTINMEDYSMDHFGLEIVNYVKTKSETKILLEYTDPGNPNIQGRCGGAVNSGYIILSFDSKNNLNYKEEEEVENCRFDIYSEEMPSADKNLLKFKITDSSQEKEVETRLTVDTRSISFIKEKHP